MRKRACFPRWLTPVCLLVVLYLTIGILFPSRQIQHGYLITQLIGYKLGLRSPSVSPSLAQEAVKKAFLRSWQSYKNFAWGHDELAPIWGGYRDTSNGHEMALLAAMDTLWIMGFEEEFKYAVWHIASVNFTQEMVSSLTLETASSRILGGLLGAYDISEGKYPVLIEQAQMLGDTILTILDTSEGMPMGSLNMKPTYPGSACGTRTVTLTEISALSLEFTRLSQATGEQRYLDAVVKLNEALDILQRHTTIPGLWPETLDAYGCLDAVGSACEGSCLSSSASSLEDYYSLSGGIDTVYSSLLKQHSLLGTRHSKTGSMYKRAASAIAQKLLFRPQAGNSAPSSLFMAGNLLVDKRQAREKLRGQVFEPVMSQSACSASAMFALGGRSFQDRRHVKIARHLAKGCIWAHETSRSGVMPDAFIMTKCANTKGCDWAEREMHQWWNDLDIRQHEDFDLTQYRSGADFRRHDEFAKHIKKRQADGMTERYDSLRSQSIHRPEHRLAHEDFARDRIWHEGLAEGMLDILSREYDLQPHTIESMFVLFRTTGDDTWREKGWKIFEAIDSMTATRHGNARLLDTTAERADRMLQDVMQSWWLSATLKYAYLLFSDPHLVSLDEYVFNSQGHPFRRPR